MNTPEQDRVENDRATDVPVRRERQGFSYWTGNDLRPKQRQPARGQRGIVRTLAVLMALGMLAVHYMVLHTGEGHLTTFRLAIGMAALPVALAFLAIALSPARLIDRIWRWGTSLAQLTELTQPCQSRGWGIGLMAVGWGSYLALLAVYLSTPNNAEVGDQGTYLATADWINAHGGLLGLGANMISGEYPEANRQPLFIAILSLVPNFTAGRLLSAAFGIATLALLGTVITRRYGLFTAGILTVLLGTNKLFLLSTSRVVCEGLLGLLCAWLWWRTVGDVRGSIFDFGPDNEGFFPSPRGTTLRAVPGARRADEGLPERCQDRRLGEPLTPSPSPRGEGRIGPAQSKSENPKSKLALRLCELGVLTGLVWLTKGTGLLMLVGLVLWWVWQSWPRWTRMAGGTAILAVAFCLTSSLLIARNVVRFGEPFYNVNTLLLFSDKYEQMDEMIAEGIKPRAAARRYLESHSVAEMLKRGVSGVIWEKFILLRSLGPAPWGDGRVIAGTLLAVLAGGVFLFRGEFRRSALLPWLAVLIPMFGWYVPIAAGDRFVVPLLPGLLVCAAIGATLAARRLQQSWGEGAVLCFIGSGLIAWASIAIAAAAFLGPNEFAPG